MITLSIRCGTPAALPLDVLLSMIPSLPRAALDRLTERMIDRIDEIDGDADLEQDDDAGCDARDDGCGMILHRGQVLWGYERETE